MERARAFRTSDPEEATAVLSTEYSALRIRPSGPASPFDMCVSSAGSEAVRVSRLTLSNARVATLPLRSYVVAMPVCGQVTARTERDSPVKIAGSTGIVASVGRSAVVDYASQDCSVLTALFDKVALEDELTVLLGYPVGTAIEFAFEVPTSGAGPFWRVLDLLRDELDDGPDLPLDNPLLRRRLDKLAMAALLFGYRHNYSEALSAPAGVEGPKAVRDALQLIEEQPLSIATVADLARASGLSVRALEAGFRRHVGMAPMAHLRDVRMRRAHDDLLASSGTATTATEVAYRWGFFHYGRFAAAYKARFGRSPAETLRGH